MNTGLLTPFADGRNSSTPPSGNDYRLMWLRETERSTTLEHKLIEFRAAASRVAKYLPRRRRRKLAREPIRWNRWLGVYVNDLDVVESWSKGWRR